MTIWADADPGKDDRVLLHLRMARAAWNSVLELSMAKDRMIVRGIDTTEIDRDIAGASDAIRQEEGILASLGYKPRWMEKVEPEEREPKRKRKVKPHQEWRQLPFFKNPQPPGAASRP